MNAITEEMLTDDDRQYFGDELSSHERKYLAGTNPRQQSGFGRDEQDWERYRRIVTAPIDRNGTFLDIGCANGLLMESIARWTSRDGLSIEPYGLDISPKLAELARGRLPEWRNRIFVGNALFWNPPSKFDFVRTEMVYVPDRLRRQYAERLLEEFVAPGGYLIACSYGSSRPEGNRADPLVEEIRSWGLPIHGLHDVISQEHGFVVTRAVSVMKSWDLFNHQHQPPYSRD